MGNQETAPLTCEEARERLPWLANESLSTAEAAAVEDHLAGCAACRGEREATGLAMRLFATHPSPADLVAYTFGDLAARERELVAGHLAECAACREEQALAGESRQREVAASTAAHAPAWRHGLPAAAAALALVTAGGWLWTWQSSREAGERWSRRERALGERVAALERRVHQPIASATAGPGPQPESTPAVEAERLAGLERELASLRLPQAGLAVVELLPEEMVVRGQPASSARIDSARGATLLLVGGTLRPGEQYTLSAQRGARQVWQATQTAATAGELTLHLPAGSLPTGEYVLRVRAADGRPVATYRLQVD
jgi:hypothetical protein